MGRLIYLVFTLVLVSCPLGFARTWHVNPDGTGDVPTIQAAVDSATDGDDLVLADGVYSGPGNRNIVLIGKWIDVHSGSGNPSACIIDCQRLGYLFEMKYTPPHSAELILDGVTIRNGRGQKGGAISDLIARSLTATNCVFDDDSTAVYFWSSSGHFTDCVFVNNSGGAVFVSGGATEFIGCSFLDNSASPEGGGGVYLEEASLGEFMNCTFCRNDGGNYGLGSCVCLSGSEVAMGNCTLYDNQGFCTIFLAADYRYGWDDYLELANTIIVGNAGGAVGRDAGGGFRVKVTCCDIYGNRWDWVGAISGLNNIQGNFSICPSFCAAGLGDLHLCDQSPCAPGNHPASYNCGLIGAWGSACSCGPSKNEPSTWGAIKAMYK
jgi:hypothetical protein